MVVGSSLTFSCQLDRILFFYFILTLFYPTEELPQENYPPPLARSPSLFRQSRNRDDKTLFYPTEELPQENYLYALWARYTVVRYTYGAIYTLYAIYFASEMHLKSPTQFRNLPFSISNLQLNKKYPPATAGGYLFFNLRYRYSVFTLTESTQAERSDSWVTF